MKSATITLCEQTHAKCQGFSCSDHIETITYSVAIESPKIAAALEEEICAIEEASEVDMQERTTRWKKNNPDEKCKGEGEEFIGYKWIDWYYSDDYDFGDEITGAHMLLLLKKWR